MRISDWSSDVCSSDLNLGIFDDAVRIIRERRVQRFAEGHRLGRDHMFQRTTLDAGEDRRIELLGQHLVIGQDQRSEEHTSELQSLMRISYAVFCLKKKKTSQSIGHLQLL